VADQFKVIFLHFPGPTGENHKKSGHRFEVGISKIRCSSASIRLRRLVTDWMVQTSLISKITLQKTIILAFTDCDLQSTVNFSTCQLFSTVFLNLPGVTESSTSTEYSANRQGSENPRLRNSDLYSWQNCLDGGSVRRKASTHTEHNIGHLNASKRIRAHGLTVFEQERHPPQIAATVIGTERLKWKQRNRLWSTTTLT
jgi:hypothetical protein